MQEAEPKRESDVDHRRCFCVSSPSAHLPTQPLIPFWFPSRFPICVTPPPSASYIRQRKRRSSEGGAATHALLYIRIWLGSSSH